ncbi:hypothetical protein KEM54_000266, partial [Ascosphaera aggregata]
AAAARINAQIHAKQASEPSTARAAGASGSPTGTQGAGSLNKEIYVEDGDYIKDIEVNDLRNRYTLTKGSTQKMIKDETGAVYQDVTTRGSYLPDKSMATPTVSLRFIERFEYSESAALTSILQNPPLYLHVTSTTKEGLEKAVARIEELMKQELPNLVDERRFRRREPEPIERDEFGRRKWPEEKIPVDLEPIPGFNLRAQVVGQGGAYVKHIQQETRCRVQIKGRGSGFVEHSTGRESDEPMYLHVAGPDPKDVQAAKELCEDLLANVKEQYERFKEAPPPQRSYGHHGGYGHRDRHSNYGGYGGGYGGGYNGGHHQSHQQHQQPHHHPQTSVASPTASTTTHGVAASAASPSAAPAATAADYSQYAQYYGGADPYAMYGGYQNYLAAYQQYYQQAAQAQQQQQQQQQSAGSTSDAPPPPPPSGSPPPPPPPSGGYNAAPPPPPGV